MFRGSVKSTGYPLHSPVSPSLPLPCVTECHHISTAVQRLSIPSVGLQPLLAPRLPQKTLPFFVFRLSHGTDITARSLAQGFSLLYFAEVF